MTKISEKGIEKAAEVVRQEISDHMSDWFSRKVARLTITAYLDALPLSLHEPSDAAWRAAKLAYETTAGPAKLAEAIRAAYTIDGVATASDPVPAGWRMVPVELTEDMRRATWFSQYRSCGASEEDAEKLAETPVRDEGQRRHDRDAYAAMLTAAPEPPVSDGMTQAVRDVLDERQRQIAKGWTADHDDGHANSEIINEWFGAKERLWKATLKTPPDRQLLVEAAAQVIAEIERVDRIPAAPKRKDESE